MVLRMSGVDDGVEIEGRSVEELKEMTEFREFHFLSAVPCSESTVRTIDQEGDEMIRACMNSERLWGFVQRAQGEIEAGKAVNDEVHFGNLILDVQITLDVDSPSGLLMTICPIERQWAAQRTEFLNHNFPKELNEGKGKFNLRDTVSRMGVVPLEDFSLKGSHDLKEEVDRLGMGIESRILELMRELNNLGVVTTQSCKGHMSRGSYPYIDIDYRSLERMLGIMSAWFEESDLDYNIFQMGEYGNNFRIEPEKNVSLQETQRDFDKLADFLMERSGGVEFWKLSPQELRFRIIRRIMDWQENREAK